MRIINIGIFILSLTISSCSQEKLTNKISDNLVGKWKVHSAALRKWDRKIGDKPEDKNELIGETYEFFSEGKLLKRNKLGDSARSAKLKVQPVDRTHYHLHVSFTDSIGAVEEKEYWEILNGRGSKIDVYIENTIGELKLNLEKI